MHKALRTALASLALIIGVASEANALTINVATVEPPPGLVSAMKNERARTSLANISGGPAMVLVNGFLTPDDLQKLGSGGIPSGNRYILVQQAAQAAGHTYPPAFFASIAAQARKFDFLNSARDSVNAQMDAQKDSRPAKLRDMHVGDTGIGNIVVDTPTCVARSGHAVIAANNQQITVRMIVAFVYANQQIYTTTGYAHDTPADTQWLANDYLSWLRGVCGMA
jgi:hypothetical protein